MHGSTEGGFAELLRELRTAKGLNRDQLAVQAGVSSSTIARLEQSRHRPDIDTLKALAQALDVPLARLVEAA